jgi:succinyl-CoA synthetase alpha subunit
MSILIDANTRVICQGITGKAGAFHTNSASSTARSIVGGCTPGKGGQKSDHGLPVFNTVHEAVAETGADASMVFVPAPSRPTRDGSRRRRHRPRRPDHRGHSDAGHGEGPQVPG